MKCPRCGSKRTAPILYGMPAFNEEMDRKLKNEELYLGGCLVSDVMPEYHCFACEKNFGTPPILQGKDETEDYRDIVTAVRFSDGGYLKEDKEIFIRKKKEQITLEVSSLHAGLPVFYRREMTETEWKKILDKLYTNLYLHEWKTKYTDCCVNDSEQWVLDIRLTGNRHRRYQGSNAFPPYWKELKSLFRPFFKEAGIHL